MSVGNISITSGFVQVRVKATATNFKSDALKSNGAFTINTSVDELQANGITWYPNPVKDVLVIKNLPEKSTLSIWSLEGKLIKTIHPDEATKEINVGDIPGGIYILKIQNSKMKVETRFIKQ